MRGDEQDVMEAKKEGKAREVRMTVFPTEGGPPYVVDVEIDEQGTFELADGKTTYVVQRGSLWQEGTHTRGLVNEGNPQTISPSTLSGDDYGPHPRLLHGLVRNNLWTQLDEIQQKQNPWKSGMTWAAMAFGVGLILMLLWQIRTMGDGFAELADALRSLNLPRGGGGNHQDISPKNGLVAALLAAPAGAWAWIRGDR